MDYLYELESMALEAEAGDCDEMSIGAPFNLSTPVRGNITPAMDPHSTYLVKLEGPLKSASQVREVAGLSKLPEQVDGTSDDSGSVSFCIINGTTKNILSSALRKGICGIDFNPTFIRLNRAQKALAKDSAAPRLGYDATLPHHRAVGVGDIFLPTQDQFPVWYFFYGTLMDPGFLAEKLALDQIPVFRPAKVEGGEIRTWAGKYKALVDGSSVVHGQAYQVICQEDEEVLRYFETDQYEIVRCSIVMKDNGDIVEGLTFRFVGESDV